MRYRVSISPMPISFPLVFIAIGLLLSPSIYAASTPRVIELTQTPCQFLESENGIDHGFHSRSIKDCKAINTHTSADRLTKAKTLKLAAGNYIFRIKNQSVPYELGFWLRGDGVVNRARLPSVSGRGLQPGKTKDYAITLKSGQYVYSCPLNNTPDYKLVVN